MTGMEPLAIAALAGTGLQAVGTIASAQAQSNAAKYNAQISEQNATIARQNAAEQEARQRRLAKKRLGALRAGVGASGVTMEGSPLAVMQDTAQQLELDALTIRHQGDLKARGYKVNAELDRTQAKNVKKQGYLKAGSQLLSGGARAYTLG